MKMQLPVAPANYATVYPALSLKHTLSMQEIVLSSLEKKAGVLD